MPEFLSPIDAISSIALLVLAAFGLFKLIITLQHRGYIRKRHFSILKVDSKVSGGKITEFIKTLKPPFAFEAAIHQLGKDVHYYLVVPKVRAKNLTALEGVEEVEDYNLFHHGGEHLGVYLKGGSSWPSIELEKIDFSKVNEVGEGVAIQMVFGRRRGKSDQVNFRILVSAPSSYQAKEIMAAIKPAFQNFSFVESRGDEFLSKVNFREFDDKESMAWSLAEQ